jgi:hypothetical protein
MLHTTVSSYFYNQKSPEKWLHIKREKFGGFTYQEKLNYYSYFEDSVNMLNGELI